MRTLLACAVGLSMALGALGCAVVSPQHRDDVLGGQRDGGTDEDGGGGGTDSGTLEFDDSCGSTTPRMLLRDTTLDIMIDTAAGYTSRNSSSCGVTTRGNDVFIGVDVVAGEYWHFHLASLVEDRDPMLYLTQATQCDSRSCEFVSAACTGDDDEHFAFVADTDGRWYIGVDDSVTGGGQYILQAYRPVCGDDNEEHGEACDDGNVADGDGCDRRCRVELSELRTSELEPNDNRVEANAVRLPASNELEITGSIGGPGACTYADVFAVSIPTAMGDLHVDALNSDGTPCAGGATTPFQLSLQNSAGETVLSNMTDTNGCAVIRATDRSAGEYFVRVFVPAETATPSSYRLRFSVLP